jgi:ABC-type siderophore export system fused ATPase/permease subunit
MIPLILLVCNVAFLANAIELSNGNAFGDMLVFIMITFILQILFVLATWTHIKRMKNNESRDEFAKFVLSLQQKGEQTESIKSKRKRSSKSNKARSQKIDR